MSSDEEDFVFFGTPIEREEEITTRKKKAVAEASGQLRTALPLWKQEVIDEEGRRRFHGAFTGGFSAGYYNTVGSKEGWAPQSFTSSRKNRAEVKQQSIYSFLDEDEKAELEGHSLGASTQFDTFGFTAAELARKQAEKEHQQRPSAIPGPVPDELVVPVTESIGVKLLLKMGWRQGRSIKESNKNTLRDAQREARKAFLALSSDNVTPEFADLHPYEEDRENIPEDSQSSKKTPAFVLNPKQDLYGLGYDPFKLAPEFREKKRQCLSGDRVLGPNISRHMKGKIGPGFGIGALEDLDTEDEDIYASGYEFQDSYVQEIEEPARENVDTLRITDRKKHDILSGFKVASNSDSQFYRFEPPEIPKDFVPDHKFHAPLGNDVKNFEVPPPEVPPPDDNNLKVLIEGVATLVARCGKLFEDLSREKNQTNPLFGFLSGGNGREFYARKLWEECQKRGQQSKLWDDKIPHNSEDINAERRGKMLGEKALERSSKDSSLLVASVNGVNVQFQLSDTFIKPTSVMEHPDTTKPFLDDMAKQKRFEQFLKEKYHGGLRSKDSGGASGMSEAARARERLEFEGAAEAIQKGNSVNENKTASQLLADLTSAAGSQFTAQKGKVKDEETMFKAMYPRREEYQWRPAPILCKRFDLIDPYMGKPPPVPRVRSKLDSLIFMPDSVKNLDSEKHSKAEFSASVAPQMDNRKQGKETSEKEVESEVEVENVERPVDLYKAIFSDDSDNDEETAAPNQGDDIEKKTEAANSTLNRLIAGDFLESLGKELGLMVPPDLPLPENKVSGKENVDMDTRNMGSPSALIQPSDIQNPVESLSNGESTKNKPNDVPIIQEERSRENEPQKIANYTADRMEDDRNLDTRRTRHHSEPSSSEEDRRSRKHLRSQARKIGSSDSDASSDSNDYRDRHRSRSRRKEKGSSREKISSRKRSRHHRSRRKDSPHRSHRSSGKDYDRKRKKHKYED